MNLTILASKLREALAVAAAAVPTRASTLPVLNHVLLDATPDGGLIVAGTDLETRAWHTVLAKVDEPGSVTLPPRPIADFLDALAPDDAVTIAVDEKHKAELTSGRTRVRLAGMDAEQFPAGQSFDAPSFDLTLAADLVTTLIRGVGHALAREDSRPVLAGILLRSDGQSLQMVAADGFRLALRSIEIAGPELDVIVQGKALVKAVGLLDGATSARLLVNADASALLLDSEAGCWSIRLIEGQFPDFRRILPKDTPLLVTTSREAMKRALALVKTVESTRDGYMARLTFEADAIAVRAGSDTADQEAATVVPAERVRGETLTVGFNTRYLAEAVEAVQGDGVTLEIDGPASPTLIRATSGGDDHLQAIMPMHVAR